MTKKEILQEFINVEGTEISEYCQHLIDIVDYFYLAEDKFKEAVVNEITLWADHFQENYKIVETEHTHIIKYTELQEK